MSKGPAPKADIDLIECHALCFVNCQGPGEPHRELFECASYGLDDFLSGLVIAIASVFPRDRFNLILLAINLNPHPLFVEL